MSIAISSEICNGCNQKRSPLKTAVLNGKFGNYCRECTYKGGSRFTDTGFAQWSRDRDREDNAKDLIQPWHADGRPNQEFIRNYPEESKGMFSQEELEQYG